MTVAGMPQTGWLDLEVLVRMCYRMGSVCREVLMTFLGLALFMALLLHGLNFFVLPSGLQETFDSKSLSYGDMP